MRRGLYIFGFGVIIGLITRTAGTGRVDFGILHFIGVAIIITYPLLPYRWLNLALGVLILLAGPYVQAMRVETLWLVWLGPRPEYYPAVDYFPLMPWLGVVLLGIFGGNVLYAAGVPRFVMPQIGHWLPLRWLQLLGRNSLFIYLIHQPLLYGLVYLFVASASK
ncbi:MAG: heparan-alpha-glucosaminide N-acetyltransferase [Caldilineaceae bacterium]